MADTDTRDYHLEQPQQEILPFKANLTGDIFQKKTDEIFKDLPNVFGIEDDILIVGYNADGRDHDNTQ